MKIRLSVLSLLFATTFGTTQAQQRNILIEKYSAIWCGHCPAAALEMDAYMNSDMRIIGVSTHYRDVMSIPDGTTATNAYIQAFPGSTIDRHKFESEEDMNVFYQDWELLIAERLNAPSSVNVLGSLSNFNPGTNEIEVNITVNAVSDDSSDFRINCYILEDSVTGGNSYDQANYYFNNDPSSPLYQKGDPIKDYVHNHVLRSMIGGPWGTAGIVSNNISSGQSFTHTYTVTLDQAWRLHQLHFVALVQRFDNDIEKREIENSARITDLGNLSLNNISTKLKLSVFPNPSDGNFALHGVNANTNTKDLQIYDIMGQLQNFEVIGKKQDVWRISLDTDLAKGVYYVLINDGENKHIARLVKF